MITIDNQISLNALNIAMKCSAYFSLIFIFLSISYFTTVDAQKISGNWTGILVNPKLDSSSAMPVILTHQVVLNYSNGLFRIENGAQIIQYEVSGLIKDKKNFKLTSASRPALSSKGTAVYPFEFNFHFNDSSGYVESTFSSPGSPYDGYKLYIEHDIKSYVLGSTPLFDRFFINSFLSAIKNDVPSKEKRFTELRNFEFEPIYFAYDEYILDSKYHAYLSRVARIIKSHSDLRIKIVGNTDGDGSNEYNLELSKQRAEAIKDYLNSLGVKTDRMVEEFNGENYPIESNDTEQGKQKNRRVEILFI